MHSRYNCAICPTRCDAQSKSAYIFEDDLALSEQTEDWLVDRFNSLLKMPTHKTLGQAHGLPDLEICGPKGVVARVEVKVQGRAFMHIEDRLPEAQLRPYETVTMNLSDLQRYFKLYDTERKPFFVIWRVCRPCLGDIYKGHHIMALRSIFAEFGDKRRFQRKSTTSDVVEGVHKGVTVNYHFSIHDLVTLEVIEAQLRSMLRPAPIFPRA